MEVLLVYTSYKHSKVEQDYVYTFRVDMYT